MNDAKLLRRIFLDLNATIEALFIQYETNTITSVHEPEEILASFKKDVDDLKQLYYHLAVDQVLYKYSLSDSDRVFKQICDEADERANYFISLRNGG